MKQILKTYCIVIVIQKLKFLDEGKKKALTLSNIYLKQRRLGSPTGEGGTPLTKGESTAHQRGENRSPTGGSTVHRTHPPQQH